MPHPQKHRTVLLLTSVQHDLLHPTGRAWPLVADTITSRNVVRNLQCLIASAREAGVPIIYSPIEFDLPRLREFAPLSAFQRLVLDAAPLAKGTLGVSFLPELAPAEGDTVLPPRDGFSSFWPRLIQPELERLGTQRLFIAGMLAHGCVESHVRDAIENGYEPYVVSDAIGAAGAELLRASETVFRLHAAGTLSTEQACEQLRALGPKERHAEIDTQETG